MTYTYKGPKKLDITLWDRELISVSQRFIETSGPSVCVYLSVDSGCRTETLVVLVVSHFPPSFANFGQNVNRKTI